MICVEGLRKSKNLIMVISLCLIDVLASMGVAFYYAGAGIEDMNLKKCLETISTNLYQSNCDGTSAITSRWTTGVIYFISVIVGVVYLILQGDANHDNSIDVNITENPVIKGTYALRNLCLFNYFNFTSEVDSDDPTKVIFKFVDIQYLSYIHVMTSAGIPITILMVSVFWKFIQKDLNLVKKSKKWYIVLLINVISIYGMVISLIMYMINAGMLGSNALIMFDVRGPSLQAISLLQYSVLFITIFEYLEISKLLKKDLKLFSPKHGSKSSSELIHNVSPLSIDS